MHELWKQTNWYAYNTSTMSVGIYSKDTLCLLSSLNLLYDLHLLFLKLSFKGRQSGRRILGYFIKLQLIANLSSAIAWWHWLVRRPCKHLIAIHIRYGTQINSLSTWHAFANPLKCYILVSYRCGFAKDCLKMQKSPENSEDLATLRKSGCVEIFNFPFLALMSRFWKNLSF